MGSRCRLKDSEKFGQAVDLFSGGFLAVSNEKRPDITTEDDGWRIDHMKYEATVPQDFVQQGSTMVGRKHTKDKGSSGFSVYGTWN
jgi:hypothetical protein